MKLQWGVRLIILILAGLFILSLGRNLVRLWRAGDRLEQAEEKVQALREENWQLKKEQQFLGSQLFFEQQVRDKLNMVKPGEAVVLLPPAASLRPDQKEEGTQEELDLPVWRQWWQLFWE